MFPTRAGVQNEIHVLEREQFRYADDEAERSRLNEIRELAQQQLLDDVYNTAGRHRGRVGGKWVDTRHDFDDEHEIHELWPDRDDDQIALQSGLDVVLEQLTAEQRVLVRMRYGAGMTEYEIAAHIGITRRSVQARLERIHASVRRVLGTMFDLEAP
jgi:RNA polymerase sigma factor (sigma-70 family)